MAAARLASLPDVPLVGREAEQRRLGAVLTSGRGAVLTGDMGTGKTRLLEWLGAHAHEAGWPVARVWGNAALADLPFGCLAHLLPPVREGAPPTEVLYEIMAKLRALAQPSGRLVLLVDDAPRLDELSGGVLHQVITVGMAVVVATARHGETLPGGMGELTASHRLDVIEVGPLDRDEVAELAVALTAEAASPEVVQWLWRATGGNPLFVTEVVRDARERAAAGALDAMLHRPVAPSVAEAVRVRLDRITPDERLGLEAIATTGPRSLAMLESLGDPAAVERLEARRLVTVVRDGRRTTVNLAHPLFGEAIATSMGRLDRRRCSLAIAEQISACGMRRRDDPLVVAVARHDAGLPVDEGVALGAARVAHARGAWTTAEQFARLSLEARPSVAAGVLLSFALFYQARPQEADTLLSSLEPLVATNEERAMLATCQALNAMHGLVDPQRAAEVIAHHAPLVSGPWAYEVAAGSIGVALYQGRIADAVTQLDVILVAPDAPPRAQLAALIAGLIPLYLAGRTTEAVQLATALVEQFDAMAEGVPTVRLQAELERAEALAWNGPIDEALTIIERLYAGALSVGDRYPVTIIVIVDGLVCALRGAHASAARALRALGPLTDSAFSPWVPYLYARLAYVALRTSDRAAGMDYLDAASRASRPGLTLHDLSLARASAELSLLDGDLPGAERTMRAVRADALVLGNRNEAMQAALRLLAVVGSDELSAARDVVAAFDGALGEAVARTLAALASGDAPAVQGGILEVFGFGHVVLAGDLVDAAGRMMPAATFTIDAPARKLNTAGARERGQSVVQRAAPLLTPREGEVASMVTNGATDAEIAASLGLSVRTVHAHVRAIFTKLGVSHRHQVVAVLDQVARDT